MKLRNLLHIQENDTHIIGSLTPPFFFRTSGIMEEFIRLCDNNSIETALNIIKEKYSSPEYEDFYQRLNKNKNYLFVDDDYTKMDISSKINILTLNITRKCNLKCSYCFEDSEYRKLSNMPFDVAKKAIDTFFTTESNTPDWVIIFTGGEPLLNYDLLKKIVEYVNNKGLKVKYRIKTNATLLNDEKMDFLIENNIKIQVSLDGNEKAHNTHRKFANGKGTFEIVDRAIHKLIEKKYGSNVTISGTLTHQTVQFIDDCYAHLNSYQEINRYDLKSVMPNSHYQYAFDLEDYKNVYISNRNHNKYAIQQERELVEVKKKHNVCGIGIWNITIDIDGKIYPCYRMCGNTKYMIGHLDLLEIPFKLPHDLENIYHLEANAQCAKCYLINICKMGCYTDKLAYEYISDRCFQPVKLIIEDMLYNEFFINKNYLHLDII